MAAQVAENLGQPVVDGYDLLVVARNLFAERLNLHFGSAEFGVYRIGLRVQLTTRFRQIVAAAPHMPVQCAQLN